MTEDERNALHDKAWGRPATVGDVLSAIQESRRLAIIMLQYMIADWADPDEDKKKSMIEEMFKALKKTEDRMDMIAEFAEQKAERGD